MKLTPLQVSKLLGKSYNWVTKGLQDGVFPWGYAVKLKKWSYYINPEKFEEHTGIKLERSEKDDR